MSRVTLMPKPVIAAQISSIISSPISPIIETSGAVALPDLLSNLILSLDMEEVSGGALDSSGNNYVFDPSEDEPIQSTGQSLGYMSRLFDSVSSNYFIRSHSDTELTIGNNEWACHFWVYNNIGAASSAILSKSSAVGFGPIAASSMQLLYQSTVAKTLRLTVGLEPAASGSVTITTPSNYFPGSTWVPVLIYHDPNADVVGLKVGSNVAQTASISTGVRHGTSAWTIGALDSGTPQYARIKMAALRMWRGTGVINQIVNNSTALAFLNAQQRRHSELT